MLHQRNKDLIFFITKTFTKLLLPFYKLKYSSSAKLHLHLGSGQNIIKGFINIDGNPLRRGILYYDIRNKLPFKNGSVQYIFTSNVFEHFFPDEIIKILKNIFDCLELDGVMRIVVPDLEKAIEAYVRKDYKYFGDFPRYYKSIGGRFSNHIFCDAQHRITYDFDYLKELLVQSGFDQNKILKMEFRNSNLPSEIYNKISPFEEHFARTDLFIEVKK